MNETGPDAVPPPARSSFEERMFERFDPVPEPYLKSIPSVLARPRLDPDVEPDRRVEGRQLVQEDVGQLVPERIAIRLGREVAAFASPLRHGADDAADELPDAGLAVGRAEVAAEVLRDDDVGRH